jgi:hypothetical protein
MLVDYRDLEINGISESCVHDVVCWIPVLYIFRAFSCNLKAIDHKFLYRL